MPRITGTGRNSPRRFEKVMPGVRFATSSRFSMPAAWMSAALKAVIASGTSCSRSSTLRAVTTISSRATALSWAFAVPM